MTVMLQIDVACGSRGNMVAEKEKPRLPGQSRLDDSVSSGIS